MASARARAVAKAQAFNREQEILKLRLMTVFCAFALVAAAIVTVLG